MRPHSIAGSIRLVLLCLGGVVAACQSESNPLLTEADRLLAANEPDQARAHYLAALQSGPNAHAYRGAARCYEAVGADAQALQAFEASLDGQPNNELALLAVSRLRAKLGHSAAALEPLLRLLGRKPDHSLALGLLGVQARRPADLKHAARLLDAHVVRQSNHKPGVSRQTHLILASVLGRLGHPEQAAKVRSAARFSAPDKTKSAEALVRAASGQRNPKLASVLILDLVESQQDDRKLGLLAAQIQLDLNSRSGAQAALERLKKWPRDPELEWLETQLPLLLGYRSNAIRRLQLLLAQTPGGPLEQSRRLQLARILIGHQRFSQAATVLSALNEASRESLSATLAFAETELGRSRLQSGLVRLKPLREIARLEPRYHRLLGQLQLASEQPRIAAATFEHLIELAPQRPDARLLHAKALRKASKTGQALEQLQDNLKLFPNDIDTLRELSSLLEAVQGARAARRALEHLQRKHAALAGVAEHLGDWCRRHKQRSSSLKWYLHALTLQPTSTPALVGVVRGYIAMARKDLALSQLGASSMAEPLELPQRLVIARLYIELERRLEARSLLLPTLDELPQWPERLSELAQLTSNAFGDSSVSTAWLQTVLSPLSQDSTKAL